MLRSIPALVAATLVGCASYPAPVERLAQAEGDARTARELGAAQVPQAQLHLRLAQEQINEARSLMNDGENRRAEFVLIRAQSDAELALAEAREQTARTEAQKTLDQVATLRAQVGTTTTTGATIQEKKP